MKITFDLDDIYTGGDYSETVGRMIRDEIERVVRAGVKEAMKEHKASITAVVKKAAKEALQGLRNEKIAEIAKRMANEL